MRLQVIEFFTCGRFEVNPGDVVDFDDADAALLMEGGIAVEAKPVEAPEKAARPRKRKEA